MKFATMDRTRRQFLLGTGGSLLAIPFMPSLSAAFGQSPTEAAKRFFAGLCLPDGHLGPTWRPSIPKAQHTKVGDYTYRADLPANMSAILDSRFDALRSKMLIATNIDGPFVNDHNNSTTLAAQLFGSFEGTDYTPAAARRYSSIDQIMAQTIYGGAQPFMNSLHLAINYTALDGSTAAQASIVNGDGLVTKPDAYGTLQTAFDYIFGRLPSDPSAAAKEQGERLLVVDKVYGSYQAFLRDRRLSNADKSALKLHLDQVFELQKKVQAQATAVCASPSKPSLTFGYDQGDNWQKAARVFFDMIVLAFKCDLTRVVTFEMAPNVFLDGDPRFGIGHHTVSHETDANRYAIWSQMDQAVFSEVHYFVDRLQSEGLLDDTLVFCGNEIGNQVSSSDATPSDFHIDNHHGPYDLMFLCFGMTKTLATGYHYWLDTGSKRSGRWNQYQGAAYNEALVTLMTAMGVPSSAWEKAGVAGYGDYRGDLYDLIDLSVVSPTARRGRPIEGLLK